MWFSKSRFVKTFLSFFTGLNLLFVTTYYYGPAASFFRLNLSNVNLRGKNLAGTKSLAWANLTDAVLDGADLGGADLENAVGLTWPQLKRAHTDEHTILPKYLKLQPETGATETVKQIDDSEIWGEGRSTANERVIDLGTDVLFDFDQTAIRDNAIPILDRLATVLQQSGNSVVQLIGHTDAKGSQQYNQQLSERRAEAVKQWLTTHYGINPKRLKTTGYGSKNPFVDEKKPDGSDDPNARRKNRRVEIRIPRPEKLLTSIH